MFHLRYVFHCDKMEFSRIYKETLLRYNTEYNNILKEFKRVRDLESERDKTLLEDDYNEVLSNMEINEDKFLLEDDWNDSLIEVDDNDKSLLDDDWDEELVKVDHVNTNCEAIIKSTRTRDNFLARIKRKEMEKGNTMSEELSDVFYPFEVWPTYLLGIFLTNNFKRQERIALAAFFHGNGFKDEQFCENLIKFYIPYIDNSQLWYDRMYKFKQLFKYLDEISNSDEERKSRYYYYNMKIKFMMYYNGNVKKEGPFVIYNRFN